MKKTVLYIVSAVMLMLMAAAVFSAIAVRGGGFLDLSPLAKAVFWAAAVLFGAGAFITARKAKTL